MHFLGFFLNRDRRIGWIYQKELIFIFEILGITVLTVPLSPEMSPFHYFCSEITGLVAIGNLVSGLREPCILSLFYDPSTS